MSKELNCMNCCIGDFKHSLCDCDNGMCKEYKKVGRAEDFENEVMNRTNPKTGKWIFNPKDAIELMFTLPKCSECGFESSDGGNFCSNCGADMRGEEE